MKLKGLRNRSSSLHQTVNDCKCHIKSGFLALVMGLSIAAKSFSVSTDQTHKEAEDQEVTEKGTKLLPMHLHIFKTVVKAEALWGMCSPAAVLAAGFGFLGD